MAVNSGTLNTTDVAQTASNSHASAHGTTPDNRRLYNFGDRVADLAPIESPFFTYLSKVSKVPTDDSVFRFLEDRSKTDWTDRSFLLAAAVNGSSAVTAGSTYSFTVDCDNVQAGGDSSGGASADFLVKGMVLAVNTKTAAISNVDVSQVVVRIQTAPVDAGTSTTFQGKVLSLPADSGSTDSDILDNNAKCMVIGTSFEEGSGSPDVWSGQLDDDFGYTQIFKTAAEMSNTAIATKYRGYANEWQRIWNLKLREHKVDIERAMLFGQKARRNGIAYSEGIIGMIVGNAGAATGGTSALSYTSGKPYYRTVTTTEFNYDLLLHDFEVLFDPARGGSKDKLALASLPAITMFNKLGASAQGGLAANSSFLDNTLSGSTDASAYNIDFGKVQGSFGHSLMKIDTVHGSLALVKEPLFRGFANTMLALIDMKQVAYRPLVGNGLNRDTHVITYVQQADEDLRKDMILTEAGLEVAIPETHMLYNFEGIDA